MACCLLSTMAALRGWLVAGTAAAQTRHCHSKGTQPLHSFTVAAGPPSNAVASLGSTASELCCFQTIGLCCIVSRSRLNVIVALPPPPPPPSLSLSGIGCPTGIRAYSLSTKSEIEAPSVFWKPDVSVKCLTRDATKTAVAKVKGMRVTSSPAALLAVLFDRNHGR